MLTRLSFANFRALKSTRLDLGPLNVLIGPNGSGKSTVFQAIQLITRKMEAPSLARHVTKGAEAEGLEIQFFASALAETGWSLKYQLGRPQGAHYTRISSGAAMGAVSPLAGKLLVEQYELSPKEIAREVPLESGLRLSPSGHGLAAVLTQLRDKHEEAFDRMREELCDWMPEFDSIQFDTPSTGTRSIGLRQKISRAGIMAQDLSEGALIALALLYLAHRPTPPDVICLEEPDRGIHPRLLRKVRDALYRLAYPKENGLDRKPTQIIATTHSPYFLDLFRDHPEAVIVAEKHEDGSATFKNLRDNRQLIEIIGDAPLGEVWYSGILGGVPLARTP